MHTIGSDRKSNTKSYYKKLSSLLGLKAHCPIVDTLKEKNCDKILTTKNEINEVLLSHYKKHFTCERKL